MKGLLITLLLLSPLTALAAGIQVSPEKLEFGLNNKKQSQDIVVANPTGDVELFEVYADDYDRAITANPESFTLEAGGRKKVTITVEGSKLSGVITTNLSIVGQPLVESKIQVNTGVKIPITIRTGKPLYHTYIIPFGIIILALGGFSYWLYRRRKK